MTKITTGDIRFIVFGMFREAEFLYARVVCLFRGHRSFEWKRVPTASCGVIRQRCCERCSKVESDYSELNERGKQIVSLVRSLTAGKDE